MLLRTWPLATILMVTKLVYKSMCQNACVNTLHVYTVVEFISIGWESPAGQAYSSVADLGKLMSLLFSTDNSFDSKEQVLIHVYENCLRISNT